METPNIFQTRSMVPARLVVFFNALIAIATLALFAPAARAQNPVGVCKDSRGCDVSSGGSRDYSGAEAAGTALGQAARRWIDCKLFGTCPNQPSAADIANEQGVAFYNKRDWANAVAAFQQAVAREPNNATFRQNLANAQSWQGATFYSNGEWAKALALFQEALAKDPNNATFRQNLANAQAALRREQDALQRQVEIQRQAEVQRRAELERRRKEEERLADESSRRLLNGIRRTDPAPGLQFRLAGASDTATVPLTPFPQGVAPANAGLESRVKGSVSDGGRSAPEQLGRAAGHGSLATAATTAASASWEASCEFDSRSCVRVSPPRVASPQTPTSIEVPQTITPRMTEIRQQLDQNRVKREKLEKEIEDLRNDPQPTPQRPVEIAAKKDELNRAEQEKTYLNFSLEKEEVEAAAAPAPSQAATSTSAGQQ